MGGNQSTPDQSSKVLVGSVHNSDTNQRNKGKSHTSASTTSRKGDDVGGADAVAKSKARANDSAVRTKAHSRQSSIIIEASDIAEVGSASI